MSQPVGFQKLAFAPRLTGAALGAAAGGTLAQEDQGWTGAALGGLAGYGLGALGSRAYQAIAPHFTGPRSAARPTPGADHGMPANAPTSHPSSGVVAKHMPEVEAAISGDELKNKINAAAAKKGVSLTAEDLKHLRPLGPAGQAETRPLSKAQTEFWAKTIAPARAANIRLPGAAHYRPTTPGVSLSASPVQLPPERATALSKIVAPAIQRAARAKVGFAKLADYGFSAGVPGVNVSHSGKDERLEGMNRWVPRRTLEQAYQGLEQGLDQQALLEQAAESGNIAHPAIGAGLAAALAHMGLPASHAGLKALAGFVGGGAGAVYNRATTPNRVEDMRQAIRGVTREMGNQPTAREATPMVMSSSAGET